MNIEIRRMEADDLDDVMNIERLSFPTPWSRAAFEREVAENRCAFYLVLLVGGELIGYAGVWLVMDEGHITNIAIHPEWRSRGYGEALTRALMEAAAARGIVWMSLEVRESNAAAKAMYEKLGFVKAGVRKGYYENNEDADLMVCEAMPEAEPIYDVIEEEAEVETEL